MGIYLDIMHVILMVFGIIGYIVACAAVIWFVNFRSPWHRAMSGVVSILVTPMIACVLLIALKRNFNLK